MSANPVAHDFLHFADERLRLSLADIDRCLAQLTEEQMAHRSGDFDNSIVNLLLHLEGNMRQWILHGIAGQPDVRQRDAEFSLALETTAAEAREHFAATLEASRAIIVALTPERLTEIIDPQPGGTWRHLSVLAAIFQVTAHVQQHFGQIVLITKQLLARDLDLTMPRRR